MSSTNPYSSTARHNRSCSCESLDHQRKLEAKASRWSSGWSRAMGNCAATRFMLHRDIVNIPPQRLNLLALGLTQLMSAKPPGPSLEGKTRTSSRGHSSHHPCQLRPENPRHLSTRKRHAGPRVRHRHVRSARTDVHLCGLERSMISHLLARPSDLLLILMLGHHFRPYFETCDTLPL